MPELCLSWQNVQVDKNHLQQFNELCSVDNGVFITYPYTIAGPLMLALFAHRDFPVKAAGLLHLRNRITQVKEIDPNQNFHLKVYCGSGRFRPQGFEFDIQTELSVDSEVTWTCKSTFLKKGNFEKEDVVDPDEELFTKLDSIAEPSSSFFVPANIGKRYAKVCRDYNPIHISNIAAMLFGYKRSIAHGMWAIAKAVNLAYPSKEIKKLDVAFKGPVFSKRTAAIVTSENTLNLRCGNNPRPVILANLE